MTIPTSSAATYLENPLCTSTRCGDASAGRPDFMTYEFTSYGEPWGSWLVRDGASLHLVGAVLNHKDQKTTAGYAYFQTEDRQRALDRHGESVVQVSQHRTHQPTNGAPQLATTQPVETTAFPRVHRISRKDLYELIWSEPTTTVARRFGISDVGLAKVVAHPHSRASSGLLGKDSCW